MVRPGARRHRADSVRRSVLRRRPAGLRRPDQGRDPAGRRAAAAAREPDRLHERRPQAAAEVLVLPARPQGRRGDDRRRSRQQRHRRPQFDIYNGDSAARLQRRRLGVRPRHLVHLPEHADYASAGRRLRRPGLRDRRAHVDERTARDYTAASLDLPRLHAARSRAQFAQLAFPVCRRRRTNRTHCIVWSDYTTQAAGRAGARHPARHQLLLLAGAAG